MVQRFWKWDGRVWKVKGTRQGLEFYFEYIYLTEIIHAYVIEDWSVKKSAEILKINFAIYWDYKLSKE